MIKRIRARDLFSADSSSAKIKALWSENEETDKSIKLPLNGKVVDKAR